MRNKDAAAKGAEPNGAVGPPDSGNEFTLLSDEPDVDAADPLGFDLLSTKLAQAILRSRGSSPFTLGIEGGWGCGKSSLMRRLEDDLCADDSVTTVWFNAWTAESGSALEGLIKTVLDRLNPKILRAAVRNSRILTGARAATMLLASRLGVGQLVDHIWTQVETDARARNELRGLMHKAMRDWRKGQAGRLLVVFVDDLDRAAPTQVFEIFEAMKLYLDAPGFVFVVGYDHTIISEAVLAERQYSQTVTGRAYIEKIVQVAYRLGHPDDIQAAGLMDQYTAGSGTAALFDEAARTLVIDRNQRNPRRIKRFLNAFVLLYALDPDWQHDQLGPRRLVEVLLLDMYFPEFVALFSARGDQDEDPVSEFLGYHQQRQAILDDPDAVVDQQLTALQRQLPELYPLLAEDGEFVALVRTMHEAADWDKVLIKLERRRRLTTTVTATEPSEPPMSLVPPHVQTPGADVGATVGVSPPPSAAYQRWADSESQAPPSEEDAPPFEEAIVQQRVPPMQSPVAGAGHRPRHLLWISERSDTFRPVMEALPTLSWSIDEAKDLSEAMVRLTRRIRPYDVVVLPADRLGAFDDVAYIRDSGVYLGLIILCTPRLTPEQRDHARSLGVAIAGSASELTDLLVGIPAGPAADLSSFQQSAAPPAS